MAEQQRIDASEKDGDTDGDMDLADENMVERELELSVARLNKAQEHVNSQELLHKAIQGHLAEQEVDHGLQVFDLEQPALGIGSLSLSDTAGYDSQERMVNARFVAEEFEKRQARMDLFERSKMSQLGKEKQHHERMVLSQKIADRQAAKRQREKLAAQREKTFHAQQRRGEQQKMLKEIQRDKERQLMLLQAKHKESLRPLPPLQTAHALKLRSASSSGSLGGGAATPLHIANEQIFKDLRQSHEMYSDQIERWEKRAADNERRTEAHRKKMLLGGAVKSKPEGKALFKKVAKELGAMRNFVKRTSLSTHDGVESLQPGLDHAPAHAEHVPQERARTPEDTPASPATVCSDTRPQSTAAKWRAKREDVKLFQSNLVEQARQKRDKDVERMERYRSLGVEKIEERRIGAALLINAWEEKSDTAAKRREAAGALNDESFVTKRQEWVLQRQDTLQRINSERTSLFQTRRDDISDVVSKGRKLLDENESLRREKIQNFDDQTKVFLEQKQAGGSASYPNMPSAALERSQPYKDKKKELQKEFRKKANDEIAKKEARLKGNLQIVRKPPSPLDARNWEGLDAHRRKPKYAVGRPSGTPSGPLSVLKDTTSPPSTGGPLADDAAEAATAEPDPPPVEVPIGEKLEQWSEVLHRRKSLTRSPTAGAVLLPKAEEVESAESHHDDESSGKSRDGFQMDVDEVGEKEFLNDLQAWSLVELKKIRRNSLEDNPGHD